MIINIESYKKNVFSQFGQDGLLEKLFEIINPINKFFVEFGSSGNDEGDGNTAYLRRFGFDGLLMNNTEHPYGGEIPNKKYDLKIETVTAENINELFKKYSIPECFDFLSIDVDGNDYWIWKALSDYYKPSIVCIEINPHIDINKSIVQKYDSNWIWGGNCAFGSSIKAMFNLGMSKNYSLIACCGADLIFIRDKSIPENIEFKNINYMEKLFDLDPHYNEKNDNAAKEINSFGRWVEV